MAHVQIYMGKPGAAIETIKEYMRLDPQYRDLVLHFLGEAHFALDQYQQAVDTLKQRLERNPDSETSWTLLASCYGHLGRYAEARAAWAETMRIDPDFSIERRRRVLPFRDPAEFERRVDGLRKAGLSA